MKLILEDSEIEELKIEDIVRSNDKGKVITPVSNHRENHPDIVKEITAIDAINLGARIASEINGVGLETARSYGNGEDIANEEVRTRVLSTKFNIADKAVTKLMETLDLFDPTEITRPNDIVRAAAQLSGIVEKVSGKGEDKERSVHLHLHAPTQRKVKDYEVIDV